MVFPEFVDTLLHAAKDPDEKKKHNPWNSDEKNIFILCIYVQSSFGEKNNCIQMFLI